MDAKTRQAAYQSAIAEYQRMTAEQQLDLASKSGKTHHFRHQWAQMTPAERAYTKMNAGGQLTAQEKQQVAMLQQQIAQMGSQNNMQLLQNEINHMRQNQQTIMGSGPRWNQTLGRWEQVGGIVTDFY
jgi:acyl-CoA reductase-like NAD-dependent aldehyde dehydrogenase